MAEYPHWSAGDERQTRNFLDWLNGQGASISQNIALTDLSALGRGRGVIARVDIEENEELFSIPQSAVLSTANSELRSKLPEINKLDSWLGLILVMIYEYNLGRHGRWFSYFCVLPAHFDTLVYWSDNELKELQGSAVLSKIGKAEADKTFAEVLLPLARQCEQIMAGRSDEYFMSSAHRMATLIMAYGFDLERDEKTQDVDEEGFVSDDEDEKPKGMVPLADMLNADGDKNNARLYHTARLLTMTAIKHIKKGEEIFNDYGPLPQSDLLRRYGYVSDEYKQWDVVEIASQKIKEVTMNGKSENRNAKESVLMLTEKELDERITLVEQWDLWEESFDISHGAGDESHPFAGFDQALLQSLHILAAPKEEFTQMKQAKKAPKPGFNSNNVGILIDVLIARGKDYQSTCAEDETLLQNLSMDDQSNITQRRKRMAIKVRFGEKHIIEAALLYFSNNHMVQPSAQGSTSKQATNGNGTHHGAKRRSSDSNSKSRKLVERR
ncbi:hypothetical protein MMC34_001514 [Xylographa carneopallida]|nr:hypothetical protein [Xylographa carneopallida]